MHRAVLLAVTTLRVEGRATERSKDAIVVSTAVTVTFLVVS